MKITITSIIPQPSAIPAIKTLRSITLMGLKDAKDLYDALRDSNIPIKFEVSDNIFNTYKQDLNN